MPIITIRAIKDVVLTSPEQKRELLQKMTDTFISVVGEVARPYTYCLIEETPQFEWSIAGRPLPDLPFLYGDEYAGMHHRANDIMRSVVSSQPQASSGNGNGNVASTSSRQARADRQWRGGDGRDGAEQAKAEVEADAQWRGSAR